DDPGPAARPVPDAVPRVAPPRRSTGPAPGQPGVPVDPPDRLHAGLARRLDRVADVVDVGEPQLGGYAAADHVGHVVVDLDPGDAGHGEGHVGEGPGRRGGVAATGVADPHPVADLLAARADAGMQAAAADHPVVDEHAAHAVARVPQAGPAVDELQPLGEADRLPDGPGHPRTQVVEALDHGLVERGDV